MNAFELTAASTFLSYFPDDIDYLTLINRLNNEELGDDDEAIDFWQPFEYYPGSFIAESIETLHHQLVKTFHINSNTPISFGRNLSSQGGIHEFN